MSVQTTAEAPATTKLAKGTFRLQLRPDGSALVPDLAAALIPLLQKMGADESLWEKQPCYVKKPNIVACRSFDIGWNLDHLRDAPTHDLWKIHAMAMRQLNHASRPSILTNSASLLDLKIELASRLLRPCTLCERRCGVDRASGETGFCGLSNGVQVAAYSMLYNEGPLVGAPTFSVFVRGCTLRCTFCYRPDELRAKGRQEMSPTDLATILDRAAEQEARSWHFLGGNPDESLPGILRALSFTTQALPVVWNSALMLIPDAIELLKGVVDIWLPDFKFGNDECAQRTAQVDNYVSIITRNLLALRGQKHVVVRHMMMEAHEECCTGKVFSFLRENLPEFSVHSFPCYTHIEPNRKKS
jgi:putative pyruvate formate lyase activating enzyme